MCIYCYYYVIIVVIIYETDVIFSALTNVVFLNNYLAVYSVVLILLPQKVLFGVELELALEFSHCIMSPSTKTSTSLVVPARKLPRPDTNE